MTLAAACPFGLTNDNSSQSRLFLARLLFAPRRWQVVRRKCVRERLAEPFIHPLTRAVPRPRVRPDLRVTGLLVRAPAPPVGECDPVVGAVQAELVPRICHAKTDSLARDAAAVEVVTPDEDAGLAITAHPVDAKDAGEADGVGLAGDRPQVRGRAVGVLLHALFLLLGRLRGEAWPPKARRTGFELPRAEERVVLARRRAKLDAVLPDDPRSEQQA